MSTETTKPKPHEPAGEIKFDKRGEARFSEEGEIQFKRIADEPKAAPKEDK